MRQIATRLFTLLVLVSLASCSGGEPGGEKPDVDPQPLVESAPEPEHALEPAPAYDVAKLAKDATDDEIKAYCTDTITKKGGPGHVVKCDGGMTSTIDTVEKCVKDMGIFKLADCPITVGQLVACQENMAAEPCAGLKVLGSPECKPIYADCLFKQK